MPLFVPSPQLLRPERLLGSPDRVPDGRAAGTPEALRAGLVGLLGGAKVLSKVSDLVKYASDASPYRFVPQVVVLAETVADVAAVFRFARLNGRTLVFRAAGTSLNGQAQGEDILVDVRRAWTGARLLPDGVHARIAPGTTVLRANAALARHGRLLGPDPASGRVATVGGVVANNACGMTAGTTRNSYRLLSAVTFVLPSGTVVDTGAADADERLREAEPALCAGLLELKREVEADPALVARIRAKYELKNTNGYRLDALLDGDTPVRILRGLVVGSQGTLGFIADTVFETVPLERRTSTALLFFPSLADAAAAVPGFNDLGARAVELMDGNTLRALAPVRGVPDDWARIPREVAALLVEFRAPDDRTLDGYEEAARRAVERLALVRPVESAGNAFTRDRAVAAAYWHAREAFVTAVGGARPPGTTLITEDFAVPPARLAEACTALLELQAAHGFDAAVSGHAAHGNLHFLLTFDASRPEDVRRYAAFMDAFCTMTVERFDGALKAEHATGRNLAPYLALEWGERATAVMWRIKELFDPHGVLAPGVVLSRDPEIHLKGLKTVPPVEAVADPCIECGFCEAVCPSHDLTTSPRQRIVLRREMTRQDEGSKVLDELLDSYGYDAVDTCAGDSTCKLACPVGIDTGALMKDFRHRRHSAFEERNAEAAADRFALLEAAARTGLGAAARLPDRLLAGVTGAARAVVRPDLVPAWLPEVPAGAAKALPPTGPREGAAAVYYVACVNRIFDSTGGGEHASLPQAVVDVSRRAGKPVWIPADLPGTCCATIWHSKGYDAGNALMANRIVERAWEWTGRGALPLLVDASSCTLGIAEEVVPYLTDRNRERHAALTVVDSTTWAARLLPDLTVTAPLTSAVLHPTCSMRHLDVVGDLTAVAGAISGEAVTPVYAECCGFAGDRGLLHEELTASATRQEAAEVLARDHDAHLSANRTCEIGMDHATGRRYRSVLIALEQATRPPGPGNPVAPAAPDGPHSGG
ncbi:FAD-binding and (Fe-S)-binding domain-containing protein [Kitasatospora phosalacinea]|uniref:FAD-binding and (Fe-S)-binding domain-containing protein n=1 Tax=Kitasatospora phosalacinea TaxID=2065 RepID=UPI0036664CA8